MTGRLRLPSDPARRPLDDEAVFIGGMPRSGTSLMRDIIGSHPDVAMFPGELPVTTLLAGAFPEPFPPGKDEIERLVEAFVEHPRMERAGIELDRRPILDGLAAEPAITRITVLTHVMRQHARQAGRPRWGVKEPLTEFCADRLLAELPRATVVHMVRDPRDVVSSQRAIWGSEAQHVVSTTYAWRRSAALAHRQPQARARGYVAVRYENLVADPAAVVAAICEGVGIAYRPELLLLSARPPWWVNSSDPTSSKGRADIFASAVSRHVRDLPVADCCFMQLRARDEMERWGYQLRGVPLTAADRSRVGLRFAQEAAWRPVKWWRDRRAASRG